jgi:hypothetical protein
MENSDTTDLTGIFFYDFRVDIILFGDCLRWPAQAIGLDMLRNAAEFFNEGSNGRAACEKDLVNVI